MNGGLNNTRAHLIMIFATALHASQFNIAVDVLKEVPPFGLIVIRSGIAASLFFITSLIFKEKINKKDWPRIVLCSICGTSANMLLFYKGMSMTTAVNSAIILTSVPILVLIISSILIKERLNAIKIIAIAIGLTGVLVLQYDKLTAFDINNISGDLFVFINAMFYGTYLVLVKPLMKHYHPLSIFSRIFLIGFLINIPFGMGDLASFDWMSVSYTNWSMIFYIGILTTFGTFALTALVLKKFNPSMVGNYIYLQPVFVTLFAILSRQELIQWTQLAAGIMIFSSLFLMNQGSKSKFKRLKG